MHFFAFVRHFIYDIFHFDGKFFDTLRYLMFKPGFVPAAFVKGQRMRYLDPVRMYLFTSALFFLLFFLFANTGKLGEITGQNELSKAERFDLAARYQPQASADSVARHLQVLMDTSYIVVTDFNKNEFVPYDSVYPIQWRWGGQVYAARKLEGGRELNFRSNSPWLEQGLEGKWRRYKAKYGGDTEAMLNEFFDKLIHRFPYLLFLSLPFFALILKLLYIRNKKLFYFDHGVFTLYHYVFSFILLLLILGVSWLADHTGWDIFTYLTILLVLSWPVHLYLGMCRFYGQGKGRTFIKFLLLNLLGSMLVLVLFIGIIFFSVYTL